MNKRLISLCAGIAVLGFVSTSEATMKMQKDAKALGFPVANCLYCHNEKLPTKTKITNNDRGDFLVKTKEAKKAKEFDMAWLKDYVEPKK